MVRLLLLALTLQVSLPVIEGIAPVSLAPAGSLGADLSASLCHDASANQPAEGNRHEAGRHCLLCLPLVGDHAAPAADQVLSAPSAAIIAMVSATERTHRRLTRHILASSRAPPSSPRTT